MSWYIHIDGRVFTDMKLSGNEAILFALVYEYVAHGQKFEHKVDDIAARLNIPRRTTDRVIDSLCSKGYIKKERRQAGIRLTPCYDFKVAKMANPELPKWQMRVAKTANQDTPDWQIPPIIPNNSNKGVSSEQLPPVAPPVVDYYEYISVGIQTFYEEKMKRPYAPNWSTHTTNAKDLAAKVDMMLKNDGVELTDDNRDAWWKTFLDSGWRASDKYIRDHWDLDTINKQFNTIISKINGKHTDNNDGSDIDRRRAFAAAVDAMCRQGAGK